MIPKYKVWDKKRAEMINLIAINFHKYIPMDDLTCSCSDGPITRNFQDVVLMQSTGLHDNTMAMNWHPLPRVTSESLEMNSLAHCDDGLFS